MISFSDQIEFNKRCCDAAFGYASAMTAASGGAAVQVFGFWADVLTPVEPAKSSPVKYRRPRSKYSKRSSRLRHTTRKQRLAAGRSALPYGTINAVPGPAEMMQIWMDMDLTRAPGAWPMAYGMMSVGVPKGVAWPTAEANLAVLDAVNVASRSTPGLFGPLPSLANGAGVYGLPPAFLGPFFRS